MPGHGPPTDRAGMVAYRAMLQTVGATGAGRGATGGIDGGDRGREARAAEYEESFGSQSRADQFVQLLVVGFSRQGAVR